MIHVIGGGLAGCEAAWQAASRGVPVTIHEMRPARPTAVHKTDRLAELVCSNSFRADKLENAVGLLKAEMRRLGSLVMRVADATRVPAGAALAVDRDRFAAGVDAAVTSHPLITVVREEVTTLGPSCRLQPDGRVMSPLVVATGPLTSDALSAAIATFVGQQHLAFYDAISPIVLAETIDRSKVFRASRYGRSLFPSPPQRLRPAPSAEGGVPSAAAALGCQKRGASERASTGSARPELVEGRGWGPASTEERGGEGQGEGVKTSACATDDGEGDYLNCPLDEAEYARFHDALIHAALAAVHDVDREKFFEGCLPVEVMARRGADTLRFGPMKPVGLVDPRTGRQPYAVVQLRQDTLAGDHFSMVGFQTQVKWGEQARVFRLIPGLEQAVFVRYGMVHRNTYICAPRVLHETWQTRAREDVFFAGQISGVEGYVESAASGLVAGLNAAALAGGRPLLVAPRTTAIGALGYYVSHADPRHYDPTNITFGIMPPLDRAPRNRQQRNAAIAARALRDLEAWMAQAAAVAAGALFGSAAL